MTWEQDPAHNAVELENVSLLRDLLDAGADVEGDAGDGFTLLMHALDIEADSRDQGRSLHVDVTALLVSRGADLERKYNGISALEEARVRGHWLAVELMESWLGRNVSGKLFPEISHSVLSGGAAVRAVGEAEVAGSADTGYFGLEINNHSGHFLPSEESLQIGTDAFAEAGIEFP